MKMGDDRQDFSTKYVSMRVPYNSMEQVVEEAKLMKRVIESNCPPGRAKSLALTKLDECVMWAKASYDWWDRE